MGDFHRARRRLDLAGEHYQRAARLGAAHPEALVALAEHRAGYLVRDPEAARVALAAACTMPIARNIRWAVE